MQTGVLIRRIKEDFPELTDSSIYNNIKNSAQDPDSIIRSRKGYGGGYFLVSPAKSEEATEKEENKDQRRHEKHLWPLVALWFMASKGVSRASCDVANFKRGGLWSNPDVVCLNITEALGFFDVEIWTAEVKTSLNQWKQYFFEAVAHKRFSERVYFVYVGRESEETRLELLTYAEKYDVGLVEIQITEDQFSGICEGYKLEDAASLFDNFVEIAPAPYDPVSVKDKVDYLRRMGLTERRSLYEFGTETSAKYSEWKAK